ncbi:hypothetical protein FACS189452_05920 [Bacteroidia bacterium]|nr:hypothetical protein FACS189452_05920 [Bacteroidia bacterium]
MMKRFGVLFLLAQLIVCYSWGAEFFDEQQPQETQQAANNVEVLVYPNPFANELNIRSNDADIKKVEIWTFKHELAFIAPFEMPHGTQLTVNTSTYAKGYYVVKVYFDNSITKTVLISK